MPGKECDGGANGGTGTVKVREAKAYSEGRTAAKAGDLIGTNPHIAGSDDANAWDAGHNSWSADPASGPAGDCVARGVPFGGGFTP